MSDIVDISSVFLETHTHTIHTHTLYTIALWWFWWSEQHSLPVNLYYLIVKSDNIVSMTVLLLHPCVKYTDTLLCLFCSTQTSLTLSLSITFCIFCSIDNFFFDRHYIIVTRSIIVLLTYFGSLRLERCLIYLYTWNSIKSVAFVTLVVH